MNTDSFFVSEILTSDFTTFTKVVGVTKTNEKGEYIQTLLRQISSNAILTFKPEPNNPYDPNAIRVYANNNHIGYLNKELAGNISYFLKNNPEFVLVGTIAEITGSGNKNKGCNIKIMFKTKNEASALYKRVAHAPRQVNIGKLSSIIYAIVMIILFIIAFNTDGFFATIGMVLLFILVGIVGIFVVMLLHDKK